MTTKPAHGVSFAIIYEQFRVADCPGFWARPARFVHEGTTVDFQGWALASYDFRQIVFPDRGGRDKAARHGRDERGKRELPEILLPCVEVDRGKIFQSSYDESGTFQYGQKVRM